MQKTLEQDKMNLDTAPGASGAGPVTKVGLVRDARHRYSWNGGPLYPSVTTILGIKDKPALVGWAKRETAACAVRNLDVLERMVRSGGPQAAVDWLKRIPDYARDASADLGSAVHAAAEAIARGEPVAVAGEVRPFIAAYRRDFLEAFQPRFIAVEAMVCSERYEYGGTADAFAEIDGEEAWPKDLEEVASVGGDEGPDLLRERNGLAAGDRLGGGVDRGPQVGRGVARVVGDPLQPVDRGPRSAASHHPLQHIEVPHRAGRRLPLRPAHEGGLVLDPEDRRHRRVERAAVPGVAVARVTDEADPRHRPRPGRGDPGLAVPRVLF